MLKRNSFYVYTCYQFLLGLTVMINTGIFLSLGSNLGNRESNLLEACGQINQYAGTITRISSVYETDAWGNTAQDCFLNQVLELKSTHQPESLLRILRGIENTLGRIRSEAKWQPRTIDIDILYYGDIKLTTPDLSVPHPELENRRFVLVPLAEIAETFVDPRNGKTVGDLLRECPDLLGIRKTGPGLLTK